jgi:hypothetical protein
MSDIGACVAPIGYNFMVALGDIGFTHEGLDVEDDLGARRQADRDAAASSGRSPTTFRRTAASRPC